LIDDNYNVGDATVTNKKVKPQAIACDPWGGANIYPRSII
jgi:hypothetical protein